MQSFESIRVQHSLTRWMDFEPASVWAAFDPSNPLDGSLRGDLTEALVVSDGRRHTVALVSQVKFGRPL